MQVAAAAKRRCIAAICQQQVLQAQKQMYVHLQKVLDSAPQTEEWKAQVTWSLATDTQRQYLYREFNQASQASSMQGHDVLPWRDQSLHGSGNSQNRHSTLPQSSTSQQLSSSAGTKNQKSSLQNGHYSKTMPSVSALASSGSASRISRGYNDSAVRLVLLENDQTEPSSKLQIGVIQGSEVILSCPGACVKAAADVVNGMAQCFRLSTGTDCFFKSLVQ